MSSIVGVDVEKSVVEAFVDVCLTFKLKCSRCKLKSTSFYAG